MSKVAVVGVGQTKFSGAQDKSLSELFAEAAFDALADSGLKARDAQALFIGNALGDFSEGQGMTPAFIADYIGARNVPANRYDGACASASMAVRDAFLLVASGVYDVVIAGGVERAASLGTPLATRTFAMFSDSRYEFPAGMTFPGVFALLAHRYAARYGLPIEKLKEQMAQVSVQSYKRGLVNPKAHLRKAVTIADVLKSFTVASPIQLHDCCPFSDGAAALVIVSEDKAKMLSQKPVYIAGAGQASSGPLASQGEYLPRLKARELAAKQAYAMAGVTPADIDVCELHRLLLHRQHHRRRGSGILRTRQGRRGVAERRSGHRRQGGHQPLRRPQEQGRIPSAPPVRRRSMRSCGSCEARWNRSGRYRTPGSA